MVGVRLSGRSVPVPLTSNITVTLTPNLTLAMSLTRTLTLTLNLALTPALDLALTRTLTLTLTLTLTHGTGVAWAHRLALGDRALSIASQGTHGAGAWGHAMVQGHMLYPAPYMYVPLSSHNHIGFSQGYTPTHSHLTYSPIASAYTRYSFCPYTPVNS